MIEDAMNTYVAFQEMCAETALLEADDWINVEEVFGVAEALKYAGIAEIQLDAKRVNIDDLITRIQTWIWKTYQQLPVMRGEARAAAMPNRKPYRELFWYLKNLGLAQRTTIITTNYDIVAEYSAYLAGIPVHYPMAWNPALGVGSSEQHFVSVPGSGVEGPMLCKLHGSINFFELWGGELLVAADLGDGKEKIGLTPPRRFAGEPTIAMYDAIWRIEQDYPGATPGIIPPSYAKLQQRPWLSRTWQVAADALANANTIVFIGYSLPRTDGFMRALLVGSQLLRQDPRDPRIVVVDKSEDVRAQYEGLFHSIEPRRDYSFAAAMELVIPRALEEAASR